MLVDEKESGDLVPQKGTIRRVPEHLLQAPKYRKTDTTQREKLYKVAKAVVNEEDRARQLKALNS